MTEKLNPKEDKKNELKRDVGEQVYLSARLTVDKSAEEDTGDGIVEATITTQTVDHHGEQIITDGIDISQYHGIVLYGHDYQGLPIGKTIALKQMKKKWKAKFQLAIKEYDFAEIVYKLIKGGYLTDVSIGGIVKKWSEDYTRIEEMTMKEFSVVPIGANADAMITAFKSIGVNADKVRKDYQQFTRHVLLDKLSGMQDDEIEDAVSVLKNLTARLEETARSSTLQGAKANTQKRIVLADAKKVATQSQNVIKVIKLTMKEDSSYEQRNSNRRHTN